MGETVLEMKNICKSFYGVEVLKNVNLTVKKGEVLCLLGENGAGKSTLIKILAGVYTKDSGEIIIDGISRTPRNPFEAQNYGISFIFQELSVVDTQTVYENMTLGYEKSRFGIVDRKAGIDMLCDILEEMKIDISLEDEVKRLSVSQKQMMLVAKALAQDVKIIVLDEPTASLTDSESEQLFLMMDKLKKRGVSFIYISHRFEDIFRIGDRMTIFRDGVNVGDLMVAKASREQVIEKMVGRSLEETYPKRSGSIGDEILKVDNLSARNVIRDVSFSLKKGQVLGVAGLAGAGKTELALALFGANKITGGNIYYHGETLEIEQPGQAIQRGIALLPEERRTQGIVGCMSVWENITLISSRKRSRKGVLNIKRDKAAAQSYIESLSIKTSGKEQKIKFLSGGNQQKALIGKWIDTAPEVFLLDEPTRGVDVGAKKEIYVLINQLAAQGKGIIIFSSELPELIGMCDEIIVLNTGKVMGKVAGEEATQHKIMQYAIGGLETCAVM